MSRTPLASLIGILGFFAYIAAVVVLADVVLRQHWTVQLVYFIAAGILWVWPAKWLMFWAARKNG